jgi:hypothetical protein
MCCAASSLLNYCQSGEPIWCQYASLIIIHTIFLIDSSLGEEKLCFACCVTYASKLLN